MMIRRRKKPCPQRGKQDKIPVKEVNMKYEALKEILEKITQIEKTFQNLSNPIIPFC